MIITKNILAFVRAAAPWVAMALVLVLLTVRGAEKKKTGKKPVGDYGTEGMCLGMCFGAAIGSALGNDTGLGISLGMLLGLALGSCIHKNREEA